MLLELTEAQETLTVEGESEYVLGGFAT